MNAVKILLVDDSETELKMFELYLRQISHRNLQLHHCATIEQAVTDIENCPAAFDIMFLDNFVPPYKDYRSTMPILRRAGFKGPVVVLSGPTNSPIFDEYRLHGAQLCTDKLHMSRRLEGLIDRALQMDVTPPRQQSMIASGVSPS